MKVDLKEEIVIPQGVQVSVGYGNVTVKGPKGEVSKALLHPRILIIVEKDKVVLVSKEATKREKKMVYTFRAHINHMIKGVLDSHVYKLKICSSHFPISVSFSNNVFSVKNFLGEKIPRTCKIRPGVDLKIDGDVIIVESIDKELAGQTAASIEQLCKITNRDTRIFQDGIYLIMKAGKEL